MPLSATPNLAAQTATEAALVLRALSRWDNEGGAGPDGPQMSPDIAVAPAKGF